MVFTPFCLGGGKDTVRFVLVGQPRVSANLDHAGYNCSEIKQAECSFHLLYGNGKNAYTFTTILCPRSAPTRRPCHGVNPRATEVALMTNLSSQEEGLTQREADPTQTLGLGCVQI